MNALEDAGFMLQKIITYFIFKSSILGVLCQAKIKTSLKKAPVTSDYRD